MPGAKPLTQSAGATSERVGFSGNDEILQVFDTDPTTPISSWKTAWVSAKKAAGTECRFHDLWPQMIDFSVRFIRSREHYGFTAHRADSLQPGHRVVGGIDDRVVGPASTDNNSKCRSRIRSRALLQYLPTAALPRNVPDGSPAC